MTESLKNKTIKGFGWSAIDNVAQYLVSFLVSIVLARLLSPEDYGLIGITAIFTAICTTIINGGFNAALIRKIDATNDDYNTAFIVNFGLSVVLYLIIFFCSPLIASFFDREELVWLTRATSLGMVIGALALVQQAKLTKKIDFKSQTKITLASSIISGIVGISLALWGFGVWALVAQSLVLQIIRTILFFVVNKWFPTFKFSVISFHELFGFGWKMMVSSLLDTVWNELYQVIVGKYYTPGTLGQYTRAQGFSNLFSSNLTQVIQRVTYPVLSNIQNDKERMAAAYKKILCETMFITSISMFFLGAISEPLLYCLIGPKWHEAATYLPFLCVIGSMYPLHAINLNMLKVQGRSDLFLGLEVIKKILSLAPLFIGAFVGIFPMLYASIAVNIIAYFLNSYYSGKFIGYSSWEQIMDVAPSFGLALVIAISVYFFKYLPISNWLILPIQLIVGLILFVLLNEFLKSAEYLDIKSIVFSSLKKIRK